MNRLALYRIYRPKTFGDLVGQDHIRTILKNAILQDRISHAYLFTGPRGTGKTSTARILARAINCQNLADGEPCNTCEICTSAIEESLTDLIEMDAASHTGVDDIRDLIEKAQFSPSRSKKKIYIIDEVHMLSKSAFNALLKTLEEPPSNTHFILATTEVHKVPATIVSRCQRFDFRRISNKEIVNVLKSIARKENTKVQDQALEMIAINAKGGLRDAVSLFEQIGYQNDITIQKVVESLGLAGTDAVRKLLDSIQEKKPNEGMKIIHELVAEGVDLTQFIHEILVYLRQQMISQIETNNKEELNKTLKLMDIFYEVVYSIKDALITQLPLEIAVLKACQL